MLAQTRQVQERIGAALALLLAFPGLGNQSRRWRCCPWLRGRVQRGDFAGYGQVQVDPVQQRPGGLLR
jgi:hypothetical protein